MDWRFGADVREARIRRRLHARTLPVRNLHPVFPYQQAMTTIVTLLDVFLCAALALVSLVFLDRSPRLEPVRVRVRRTPH